MNSREKTLGEGKGWIVGEAIEWIEFARGGEWANPVEREGELRKEGAVAGHGERKFGASRMWDGIS